MRKKNKLYKANKWNQPLFAKDIDRESQNIFDGLNSSYLNTSTPPYDAVGNYWDNTNFNDALSWYNLGKQQNALLANSDWGKNNALANSIDLTGSRGPQVSSNNMLDLSGMLNQQSMNEATQKGEQGISALSNSNSSSGGWGGKAAALKAVTNAGLEVTGMIGRNEDNPRGLWDLADPVHQLAGGKESAVGNTLEDMGVSTFKQGAQSGNGWVMLAGAGLKVTGGLTNAAFGMKTDKPRLNAIKSGLSTLKGYNSDASYFDDVVAHNSIVDNTSGVYKGGWFSSGKANRKNDELTASVNDELSRANRSYTDNIKNITSNQMDNLARVNIGAFGGPLSELDSSTGAIDYNFMSDYLTSRNKATRVKDKTGNNVFSNVPQQTMFALGGDLQTNGADFNDGLSMINAGGSHEENPYDGVQMGISKENGQPNLLEEGETVFDDYVFSKRIKPDAQTKKKFHLGKNTDTTFADLSKKLEKESEERPNDAISQAGLTKQMHALAEEQERQKQEQQEKEMQKVQEAFMKLPPEQQEEIMQQMAMQEQQQPSQEEQQAMAEQQAQQPQLSAEEQQALAQQQGGGEQQVMQEQPQMEDVQMSAYGGKINKFDKGGNIRNAVYKALGYWTDSQFNDWAKKNNLKDIKWDTADKNDALWAALGNKAAAIKDAMINGYNFGDYTPPKDNGLTFDFKHGGWGAEDYDAWNGSTDAAWLEALEGIKQDDGTILKVAPGMNSEEIGKILSQTNAYKRGTDWLKASEDNRLRYLQAIFNSEDAPEAAKKYAAKYVDANGWLEDAKKDYQTIFEDPDNVGVRNTHPGTYWKTPNEILRGKTETKLFINDDGTVEEIRGDVPKGLVLSDTFNWQDDKNDNTRIYYINPAKKAAATVNRRKMNPILKDESARDAALLGPSVGLGLMMSGLGKPDYSRMDAAVDKVNQAPVLAHYQAIPNYLTYRPMDIWWEQNKLNANSRATDRAIMNNSSTLGTKTAGLLANSYNNQIASGNLFRQALEYNDAQRQKVAEFNRATNQYNADAFTRTSATNAGIINDHRRTAAQIALDVAKERLNTDASWYNNIYKNIDAQFKGLGDYGKENAQHNIIARMAADGIFGTLSDQQNIAQDYLEPYRKNQSSKGGKITRKKGRKGLTF